MLYISPLRALNNDIERNLTFPLDSLRRIFRQAGEDFPEIRALTRSGDTPQTERRKMLRHAPEILITTPESLNIMLTSKGGVSLLGGLQTVILDEVHAVAGSKRGTHLITGVERLTRLSGEFQRIALSATVRPIEKIAEWIGGFEQAGPAEEPEYNQRPVTVIDGGRDKSYDLQVQYIPPVSLTKEQAKKTHVNPIWHAIADEVTSRMVDKKALVFANSRRTVERVAGLINAEKGELSVYSHHGSLSREIREVAEERLKTGRLDGIVATNSLELGIDVGAIDEVLLVGTPPSVSSTVQRVGRAGHGVGEVSRARLYPAFHQDILNSAVTVKAALQGNVEPTPPLRNPLDVLAQIVLSMTATETWYLDELYSFVRTFAPYHNLQRSLFDLVVEMLAGRYSGTRLQSLRPRLAIDKITRTAKIRPGTERILYLSGGTIADRGNFTLRHADTMAKVGELDEEFVWERSIGEIINLGVQNWRIVRISHNDVLVTPYTTRDSQTPFWRCDEQVHGFFQAELIGNFLDTVGERLDDPRLPEELKNNHQLDEKASSELIGYLQSQKQATSSHLPSHRHPVVEHVGSSEAQGAKELIILHTVWGGKVNRPLSLTLKGAVERTLGRAPDVAYDDMCVAVALPEKTDIEDLLDLFHPTR